MTGSLLDETGQPVDLISELAHVQLELQAILQEVTAMEATNQQVRAQRDQAEQEFITQEQEGLGVFHMIKVNGHTKKKIIGLIK